MDKILVVVAHPDDEVLMAGGTIARHVDNGDKVHVLMLADGVSSRADNYTMGEFNARLAMGSKASDILGCDGEVIGLKDNRMDIYPMLEIVRHIEKRVEEFLPTVVITHWDGDMNIDHRIVSEACKVACRPQPGCSVKQLFMGEVPSSTEWAGGFNPNVFVDIDGYVQKKMGALNCYLEELREWPHPRSVGAIHALMQYRGASAGVQYAEAFMLVRAIV